ncbi:MAG: extracellular solute-binding protein [Clostridia bacterium]
MKNRKRISLLVMVALLVCSFGAIGASAEAEPITLSICVFSEYVPGAGVHPNTNETSVVITKIYEEFARRMPNVKLEFEVLQGETDGYNDYLLRGASGTLPDICMLDGYWIAAFASQGYTKPLEGRISDDILNDYYDAFKMKYNDQTHGLVYSTAFNGVVWYRESLLKAAGYDSFPTDYDDFTECIKKLTVPGERYGLCMSGAVTEATTCSLLGMYWAGQDVFVDSDNVAQFNNETSIRIFNMFKDFYDCGAVPAEIVNMNYDDALNMFASGQSAVLIHGSWLNWSTLAPALADDIRLAPLPVDPKTGVTSENAGGWAFAITTEDTAKDAAISEWFDLMLTDPDWATLRIAEAQELPVTKTISANEAYWLPEQYRDTMMSFLPLSKTRPCVTSYPTASEYYDQAFQEVLIGEKDAATALADAVANVADFVEVSGF